MMTTKKLENLVTRIGVGLLFFLTFVGILFVFDEAFLLDLFSDDMKFAAATLLGVICVLVGSSVMVSMMLNVSRIANSIEQIAEGRGREEEMPAEREELLDQLPAGR